MRIVRQKFSLCSDSQWKLILPLENPFIFKSINCQRCWFVSSYFTSDKEYNVTNAEHSVSFLQHKLRYFESLLSAIGTYEFQVHQNTITMSHITEYS